MDEATFREQVLARLGEIGAGLVDQARAIEALAIAAGKAGRGTLRVKIDAPPAARRRKKVRRA